MKSRVHPTYKTQYHVQNWAAYDRALVCRGDITIWLSPAAIAAWEPDGAGTRGAQRKYSDLAIESALTLRLLFHLPLRQTEGFLTSLFVLMGLDLRSPDHTTLSRRGQHLDRRLRGVPRVLVPVAVDSPRRYTVAMNAIDERACGKPGCDNFGKPGLNIVGHGWFVTKSGRRCLGAQLAISVNNCPPPRDPRSRMTSFKRTQRKYVQKAYRVRNWREYETGLRARGSLTVWLGLTDGKLANWNSPRPTRRKPGRQRKYSNHAIETTVTVGLVFGLASRQTEGFLRSLLTLLNLDNDVPDHSTISRRKARLGKVASYERRTVKPVHLLIDSSGLSVHVGQLRTPPKARDYRKLHLAVDEQTSDVVACALTSKRARDASRVASVVGQIERPIASAKADAAYDTGDVYTTLENHRAHRSPKVLIPPRKGAQLALDAAGTRQRNRNIRARSRVGKRKWYVASGYSRRSKVETTFHRYKAILGSAMRARGLASQRVEVRLGCKILNTMTALGIPDGEMIG